MNMKIDVPAGSHESAIDYFYGANQSSNADVNAFSDALYGYGAMAGDDSIGRQFGQQYDQAAGPLLQAYVDLSNSLGCMANLLNANLVNHDNADLSARLPPVGGLPPDADGDPDPTHYSIELEAPDPPSSIGGNSSPPHGWSLIADHLQGWVWPNADTGKLRAAGSSWRSYAGSAWSLSGEIQAARAQIAQVRSPEVDLILSACDELDDQCTELHTQMTELGNACTDYAQAVDDHHHQIIDAIGSIIGWSVVDQVLGGVLSFFSFGGSEAGAQAVEAGLIARCVARITEILESLGSVVTGFVTRVLKVAAKAAELSSKLAKFLKADRIAAKLHKASVMITLYGKKLEGVIEIPTVTDAKLKNYVDQFYKGSKSADRTGDGTTADAVRKELAGGNLVKGRNHLQKAQDLVNGLQKWIRRNPGADPRDIKVATDMLHDLQAALAGH